jgi:hypothetical protein
MPWRACSALAVQPRLLSRWQRLQAFGRPVVKVSAAVGIVISCERMALSRP